MDLDVINSALRLNGQCLNIEERAEIHLALLKLKSETKHCEIHLWGKVEGTVKDYFIALGLNYAGVTGFPKKTFYWCSSRNYNFASLPTPGEKVALIVKEINTKFTGEYDTIIAHQDGPVKELKVDDDDSVPIQIKPKNITELDRLSFVVHRIEDECHIVPEGSYKLTPIQEIRPNEAFQGLEKDENSSLAKYVHFTPIKSKDKKEQFD